MRLNYERLRKVFRKSQKLLTERTVSELWGAFRTFNIAIHSISMAGYVNALPAFVCYELPAREASSFCDFWKFSSCDFIAFISYLSEVNFFFMCLLRINLPNLCPNPDQYTKKSQYVRYRIQRHFLDNRNVDICSKSIFPESNRVFKAVLIKLKRDGLGSTKHKDSISPTDMEKISVSTRIFWVRLQFKCNTPKGLQNKVFIDLLTFFCNRGRENVRTVKVADFSILHDEDGLRLRDVICSKLRKPCVA